VELRKELSRISTLDLPATLVFDYPSTEELVAALVTMLPEPEQAQPPAAKSGLKPRVEKSAEPTRQIKSWRPPQRDDITAQVTPSSIATL
jgi:hypothetical protein